MIYFAQRAIDSLIKIGKSDSVDVRISALATKARCDVVLLAKRDGGFSEEKHVHNLLAEFRVEGEWFEPSPHVLDFIANVHDYEFPDTSGREIRLNLTIDDETGALIKEMAEAQSRTITDQVRHLIKNSPETIGWRAFKNHPEFQKAVSMASVPVKLDK